MKNNTLNNSKIYSNSIKALALSQFLGIFCDVGLRFLTTLYLLTFDGNQRISSIMSFLSLLFAIAPILFSHFAGWACDHYDRRKIIWISNSVEIIILILITICYFYKIIWPVYILIFMMSLQTTFFIPARVSLIPEYSSRSGLILTFSIFQGLIISGAHLGIYSISYVAQLTHKNFIWCGIFLCIVSIVGLLVSLPLAKIDIPVSTRKFHLSPFKKEYWQIIKDFPKTKWILAGMCLFSLVIWVQRVTHIPYLVKIFSFTPERAGKTKAILLIFFLAGTFLPPLIQKKYFLAKKYCLLISACLTAIMVSLSMTTQHLLSYFFAICLFCLGSTMLIVPIHTLMQLSVPRWKRGHISSLGYLVFNLIGAITSFIIYMLDKFFKIQPNMIFLSLSLGALIFIFLMNPLDFSDTPKQNEEI